MRKETIGSCTLYLGDCLEILPEISRVDSVVTDPPYFLSIANDCHSKLNPWANVINGSLFVREFINMCLAKLPLDSCIWSFTNWQGFAAFQKAGFDCNCSIRSVLVWDKANKGPGIIGLRPSYELVCLFVRGNFKIQDRSIVDIWRVPWATFKPTGHPAEKPKKLIGKIIHISTSTSSTVLDPFMGSGTTGVACVESERGFIGIEQDEHWFDVACRRIEQAYRERSLLDMAG